MPNQPPHHLSSREFPNSDFPRSVGAYYAKRTQFPSRRPPIHYFTKQAQSPHVSSFIFRISGLFRISRFGFRISPDLSGAIMQNEPNLAPAQHPKNTKQTQKDNARCNRAAPVFNPGLSAGAPRRPQKDAKRTQFAPSPPSHRHPAGFPIPQLCETNPILARPKTQNVEAKRRSACGGPNEPNFHTPKQRLTLYAQKA